MFISKEFLATTWIFHGLDPMGWFSHHVAPKICENMIWNVFLLHHGHANPRKSSTLPSFPKHPNTYWADILQKRSPKTSQNTFSRSIWTNKGGSKIWCFMLECSEKKPPRGGSKVYWAVVNIGPGKPSQPNYSWLVFRMVPMDWGITDLPGVCSSIAIMYRSLTTQIHPACANGEEQMSSG